MARHAVVEGLDDGVVVLGMENHILDVNRAALRLVDRPADALIGQPAESAKRYRELTQLTSRYQHFETIPKIKPNLQVLLIQ